MEDQITQYIQNILQREPAPGEVDGWIAIIEGNVATLEEVRQMIIDTAEAVTNVYPMVLTYQAIYGRVPDADGLEYWTNVYASNLGLDDPATTTVNEALVEVLKPFVDPAQTPEFIDRYGANPTGDQFVAAAYQNVLNRVPDQDGLTYWQTRYAQIEASYADSGMTQDEITVQVRAEILEQFVNSAEYKTATAEEVDAYLTARAEGEDVSGSLWDLDPDANVGQTFTLTEGTDIINGQPGNLIGSEGTVDNSGDDTILAGMSNAGGIFGPLNNLGTGDVINGGDGFDTLKITDTAGVPIAPDMENVERIETQALDVDSLINLINAEGVQEVWNSRSTNNGPGGSVTYTNVQNDVTIGLHDTATDIAVIFDGPVITDGELDIEVSGEVHSHVSADVDFSEVTTLNINATGGNARQEDGESDLYVDIQFNDADLETLNVSGDSAIYISDEGNGNFEDLTTVVVTNTGDTWLDLQSNAADLTATMGSGNDVLEVNANELDTNDTFDGGDGEDNLWLNFANDGSITSDDLMPSTGPGDPISPVIGAVNNTTNFEMVTIDVGDADNLGNTTAISLDASLFTTIKTFNFYNWVSDSLGAVFVDDVADDNFFAAWADITNGATFVADTGTTILNLELEGDANEIVADGFTTVNIDLDNADAETDINLLVLDDKASAILTGEAENIDVQLGDAPTQTLNASAVVTEAEIDVTRDPVSGVVTAVDLSEANFLTGGGGVDTIIGTAQDDVLEGGSEAGADTPDVATYDLTGLTLATGNVVSFTISGSTVSITVGATATPAAVAGQLAGALAALADPDIGEISVDGGVLTISSATVGAGASFPGAPGNLTVTNDAPNGPFPGVSAVETSNAANGVASSGLIEFSSVAGSFVAGQTVVVQFEDATSVGQGVAYIVQASDIIAGDGAATAANVAQGLLTAAGTGIAAALPGVTAFRDGTSIVWQSNTVDNNGVSDAGEGWVVIAQSTPAVTSDSTPQILATKDVHTIDFNGQSFTAGDVISISGTDTGGAFSSSYTVLAGDGASDVANGLATNYAGGEVASDLSGVLTLTSTNCNRCSQATALSGAGT